MQQDVIRNSTLISLSVLVLLCSTCAISFAQENAPGAVKYCVGIPQFVRKLGIRAPLFMTSHRTEMGLVLYNGEKELESQQLYKDPSWSSFGWLGPMAFDRGGNIYIASVPHVNVLSNPLSQQNDLFRVNSSTGILERFLTLPVKEHPTLTNPYGVVGLTYDCETEVLYASTLSGSSRESEKGTVFALSLKNNQILGALSSHDPFGLTVFKTKSAKFLYFGLARRSDVYKIKLDSSGNFAGAPELMFNFDRFNQTRARKFSFDKNLNMTIEGIEFNFNLIASTELTQAKFLYHYDAEKEGWKSVSKE